MQLDGPTEWCALHAHSGTRPNDLLQQAYSGVLSMTAMPDEASSVVLTKYAREDATDGCDVSCIAVDHLVLHPAETNSTTRAPFRIVGWSIAPLEPQLLAIASVSHLEIREIDRYSSDIRAVLKGTVLTDNIRAMQWNPVGNILLISTDKELQLVDATGTHLQTHFITSCGVSARQAWKALSWSPSGLSFTAATADAVHEFTWESLDKVLSTSPLRDELPLPRSRDHVDHKGRARLDTEQARIGSVSALVRVSSSLCVVSTDIPLVFEEVRLNGGSSSKSSVVMPAKRDDLGNLMTLRLPNQESDQSTSSLLMNMTGGTRTAIEVISERVEVPNPQEIVDLTSLRISASSSARSSLQILGQEPVLVKKEPNLPKPTSHILVLVRDNTAPRSSGGEWVVESIVPIADLPKPDLLHAQGERVIVGSSISNRLAAGHLTKTETGWTAELSGDLELAAKHTCKGLLLTPRAPFLYVASTEKIKRTGFFHASSSIGSQRVYLSKFKFPARHHAAEESEPVQDPEQLRRPAAETSSPSLSSALDGGIAAMLLAQLQSMQKSMNDRFDAIDTQLTVLGDRMTQLEARRS